MRIVTSLGSFFWSSIKGRRWRHPSLILFNNSPSSAKSATLTWHDWALSLRAFICYLSQTVNAHLIVAVSCTRKAIIRHSDPSWVRTAQSAIVLRFTLPHYGWVIFRNKAKQFLFYFRLLRRSSQASAKRTFYNELSPSGELLEYLMTRTSLKQKLHVDEMTSKSLLQ